MQPLRRQVQLLSAVAALVAVLFVGGLAALYQRSQDLLEAELGARLRTVATATAAQVPADSLLTWTESDSLGAEVSPSQSWRAVVRWMLRENDLSRVVVFDSFRRVSYDSAGLLRPGESFLFLAEEEPAIASALEGHSETAPLRREGEVWLKAAYAPIYFGPTDFVATLGSLQQEGMLDDVGRADFVAGFVGVFAHPRFFTQLNTLRGSLIAIGAAVLGLLSILTVVTTVTARRLDRAREALMRSETLSSMGRMAAGIAHEIRNPLGIIKNSAQLLREELKDAGVESDAVDFIPAEVDRLNETLTGYLEFAREAPLRLEAVEVDELLRRTGRMLAPQVERAGVEFVCQVERPLRLQADRRRLQQVLLNLMLNALQAMPEGGRLTVEAAVVGDRGRIVVIDDGCGIEAAQLDEIFEPFETSREKGSGLGLYMARRIVEEHGASISVRSEVGVGSRFVLDWPLAPGEDAANDPSTGRE